MPLLETTFVQCPLPQPISSVEHIGNIDKTLRIISSTECSVVSE
jgi:hypothetical protein